MQVARSEPQASEVHRDRLTVPALAVLLAAIALAAAGPAYIPTHDGPQHVYAIHVANHLGDTERGWSDWFEIARPVTSLGFSALFGPLDTWPRPRMPASVSMWRKTHE